MFRRFVISGMVLALMASVALAQGRGPGRGGPGGGRQGGPGFGGPGFGGPGGMQATPMSLLGMSEVQQELGLSDDQKKQVSELQEQVRSSFRGFNFQDMQDLSQEDREKLFTEMRKKGEEANKQAEEKLGKLLEAKQVARLSQLRLQRDGVAALARDEVAKQLGLNEEQQAKLKTLQEAARPQGRGGFGGPGGERMQEQRAKAQADTLAVLTEQQKGKWAELTGKEFKFPQPQGFGGFGGRNAGERRRPPVKKRDQ